MRRNIPILRRRQRWADGQCNDLLGVVGKASLHKVAKKVGEEGRDCSDLDSIVFKVLSAKTISLRESSAHRSMNQRLTEWELSMNDTEAFYGGSTKYPRLDSLILYIVRYP